MHRNRLSRGHRALFIIVVSILNMRAAGIHLEAFRLAAMMTGPFILGFLAVSVLTLAVVETYHHLKCPV